jgi:hypothetical protein
MATQQRSSPELPTFWATIAGAAIVLGGTLIALGATQKGQAQSLWAVPWFDVGIGITALGVLVLGYSLYRYATSRAEPPATGLGRVGIASSGKARVTTRRGRIANQDRSVDASGRSRVDMEETDIE